MENIGLTIKRRRRALGVSRKMLAQLSGVSFSTVSKLEGGFKTNPTISTINALNSALDRLELERDEQAQARKERGGEGRGDVAKRRGGKKSAAPINKPLSYQ
jgi:transcriptional regulator with XRE-family HTH domain